MVFRQFNIQPLFPRLQRNLLRMNKINKMKHENLFKICFSKEELKNINVNSIKTGQKINTLVYKRIPKYHKNKHLNIITFGTKESSELVSSSINDKTDLSFYNIIDNNLTQSDPTYCGVTNLVILLNTLNIDPKSRWKGIWRWFSEENLHCLNLDLVKRNGINLDEFEVVSKCNGIFSLLFRPDLNENESIKKFFTNLSKKLFNTHLDNEPEKKCGENSKYPSCIIHNPNSYYCKQNIITKKNSMLSNELMLYISTLNSSIRSNIFTLASYSRKYFNQTGDGHFTILNLINRNKRKVLLNEIARFKYNSIWVNVNHLFESMKNIDNITKEPRGFLVCGRYY